MTLCSCPLSLLLSGSRTVWSCSDETVTLPCTVLPCPVEAPRCSGRHPVTWCLLLPLVVADGRMVGREWHVMRRRGGAEPAPNGCGDQAQTWLLYHEEIGSRAESLPSRLLYCNSRREEVMVLHPWTLIVVPS